MAQVLNPGDLAGDADQALGQWVSKAGDSQTEIVRCGNQYCGLLLAGWGNELYEKDGKTPRKDTKNPDAALRSQPLLKAVILSNLEYQDGEYTNGRYYDARTGKTFSCTMRRRGEMLEIRLFVKFKLLGMTKKWTRAPR